MAKKKKGVQLTYLISNPQPRPPHAFNNPAYPLPNGSTPTPGATPLLPNQGRVIQSGPTRILCVADVRGMCTFGVTSCETVLLLY